MTEHKFFLPNYFALLLLFYYRHHDPPPPLTTDKLLCLCLLASSASVVIIMHHHNQLRDEIYLQIMKQLSSNPTADSIAKGWQVMCMCVSTFPPSLEFELYLLNFMHEQKKKKGAVRNYAK